MACSTNKGKLILMPFPERLAIIRKEKGFTQQIMADKVGIHVSQFKRYESGTSQPTLEVFRKIILALNVSPDIVLFDEDKQGPSDDQLKLQFEAVSKLDPKERDALKTIIDGMLLMHHAKRYTDIASK